MVVIDARGKRESETDVSTRSQPRSDRPAFAKDLQFAFDVSSSDVLSDRRIQNVLHGHEIGHIFLAGCATEPRVRKAALSSLSQGYRVTFVADAIPSPKADRAVKDFESRAAFSIGREEFVKIAASLRRPAAVRGGEVRTTPRGLAFDKQRKDVGIADWQAPEAVSSPAASTEPTNTGSRRKLYWTGIISAGAAMAAGTAWHYRTDIEVAPMSMLHVAGMLFPSFVGHGKQVIGTEAAKENPISENAVSLAQATRDARGMTEDLVRDLATLRVDLDAVVEEGARSAAKADISQLSHDRTLDELKQELRREKDRVTALASELATIRLAVDQQQRDVPKSGEASANTGPTPAPVHIPEQPAEPADRQDLSAPTPHGRVETTLEDKGTSQPIVAAPSSPAEEDVSRLMERASLLLKHGDIGAARIVLERIAETGNAMATFALAETYDPLALMAMETFGTQGDSNKARQLYSLAISKGVAKANERLSALLQHSASEGER